MALSIFLSLSFSFRLSLFQLLKDGRRSNLSIFSSSMDHHNLNIGRFLSHHQTQKQEQQFSSMIPQYPFTLVICDTPVAPSTLNFNNPWVTAPNLPSFLYLTPSKNVALQFPIEYQLVTPPNSFLEASQNHELAFVRSIIYIYIYILQVSILKITFLIFSYIHIIKKKVLQSTDCHNKSMQFDLYMNTPQVNIS